MAVDNAFRAVRLLARRAGIAKTISPHSLRHTAATLAPPAQSPKRLGHADPRSSLDDHPTHALDRFLTIAQ
jgi:integrase